MAYMGKPKKEEQYLDKSKMVKIYDLSQPFGTDTPLWPLATGRADVTFTRTQFLGRFHKRTCSYNGSLHTGTHMDAPNHVLHEEECDREKYGYTLAEIPLEHAIGTGVILDMTWMYDEFEEKYNAAGGDPSKFDINMWRIITPEDVERACKKDNLEIRPNDWVVINTGFHRYWRLNNDKYYNYYPGQGPELAKYLMFEKKIKGIGGTWGATDSVLWHYPMSEQIPWVYKAYKEATGRDLDQDYTDYEPCHRLYMSHGVCTVENVGGDIDECTGKRMVIAAFPFRCEQADGGMVRMVAWEEGKY